MKRILTISILMLLSLQGFTQKKTVNFDYWNNNFNENHPLPSGENFTLKGTINPNISVVTLSIFKTHRRKDTLYATQWRRPVGNSKSHFVMPVDFKLRGNRQYDIILSFYKTVNDSGKVALLHAIAGNLENYIEGIIAVNGKKTSLKTSESTVISNMNQIVYAALTYYKSGVIGHFPGFSDIVKTKVRQLNNQKITNARYQVAHDSQVVSSQVRQQYVKKLQKQLLKAAVSEVAPYVEGRLAVLEDKRERENYPTEQISRTLSLDIGYGGVYLSGNWDDMDYASAAYAGISFPLGNESISPFWGKTSISLGVFFKNFEDKNGNKITGPIIGLPYYLGLGYKFLHILRVQAGVVATSTKKIDNIENISTKDIKLRPFIGIEAEINLWLGFDKNK